MYQALRGLSTIAELLVWWTWAKWMCTPNLKAVNWSITEIFGNSLQNVSYFGCLSQPMQWDICISVSIIHAVVVSLLLYTLCICARRYLLWGLQYVNAEAGTRQTSRCIHPRSNHPWLYTQILVPRSFNLTALGCRSMIDYQSRMSIRWWFLHRFTNV